MRLDTAILRALTLTAGIADRTPERRAWWEAVHTTDRWIVCLTRDLAKYRSAIPAVPRQNGDLLLNQLNEALAGFARFSVSN